MRILYVSQVYGRDGLMLPEGLMAQSLPHVVIALEDPLAATAAEERLCLTFWCKMRRAKSRTTTK